jgi:hypothetical protein
MVYHSVGPSLDYQSYMQMPGVQPMMPAAPMMTQQPTQEGSVPAVQHVQHTQAAPPAHHFPMKPSDQELLSRFPPGSMVLPDQPNANYNPSRTQGQNFPRGFNQTRSQEPGCCTIM